jgi:hypothetical protein
LYAGKGFYSYNSGSDLGCDVLATSWSGAKSATLTNEYLKGCVAGWKIAAALAQTSTTVGATPSTSSTPVTISPTTVATPAPTTQTQPTVGSATTNPLYEGQGEQGFFSDQGSQEGGIVYGNIQTGTDTDNPTVQCDQAATSQFGNSLSASDRATFDQACIEGYNSHVTP